MTSDEHSVPIHNGISKNNNAEDQVTRVNNVQRLTNHITDEIFMALGLAADSWPRKLFSPVVRPPASRFSEIAAGFEQRVSEDGFREAVKWILPHFISRMSVSGAETIPSEGPLVIASNHPGTVDALCIAANLPREDIKIVASNIPFIRALPAIEKHFIHTTLDVHVRMTVLRSALRHLREGGSLLVFASGGIDPDPAGMPGAMEELERWSPSLEFFLRKVPQTQMLVTIVSGVLSPTFLHHPFTLFRRQRRDKQRIAEFLQTIKQMLQPEDLLLTPKVTFANPLSHLELSSGDGPRGMMKTIIQQAKSLMTDHAEPTPVKA
jgi:hypothetical protein